MQQGLLQKLKNLFIMIPVNNFMIHNFMRLIILFYMLVFQENLLIQAQDESSIFESAARSDPCHRSVCKVHSNTSISSGFFVRVNGTVVVLTVAHFIAAETISWDGGRCQVRSRHVIPSYNDVDGSNDLQILTLSTPVEQSVDALELGQLQNNLPAALFG